MIWISGVDKKCTYFNEPWLHFTGRTLEQELGDGWAEGVHSDDFARCLETYTTCFDQRKPFTMSYRLRRSDGQYRWILDNGVPYYSFDTEKFQGYVGSCIDITDQKQLEQDLLAAGRAKSDFLALMSHEIRTPLAIVIGMAELVAESPPVGDLHKCIETILQSARHLLLLLSDILDVVKLTRSDPALPVSLCDFHLDACVQECVEMLRCQAEQKRLTLHLDLRRLRPEECNVRSDPIRLRQILGNIIGNGIKYTDSGSIDVVVTREPSDSAFIIRVVDTGTGIPEHYRSKLFTAFTQAELPDTRTKGGTGLGLYISDLAARSLNGTIQYSENTPRGSIFTIKLPLQIVPPSDFHPEVTTGTDLSQLTRMHLLRQQRVDQSPLVLVVEDNEVNRKILVMMLERCGLRCDTASDGIEAVTKAQQTGYKLIFMDVQMPNKDGCEATREIRAQADGKCRNVPIVALTALALAGDRERCLSAGMNDYLAKPYSRAQINALLKKWM